MGRKTKVEETRGKYREGQTVSEFARQEGLNYFTALSRLRTAGIETPFDCSRTEEKKERTDKMVKEYLADKRMSISDVARKYGISRQRASVLFKERGVRPHSSEEYVKSSYKEGQSAKEYALQEKIPVSTAYHRLKRIGVDYHVSSRSK